jgi:hypothetical protein
VKPEAPLVFIGRLFEAVRVLGEVPVSEVFKRELTAIVALVALVGGWISARRRPSPPVVGTGTCVSHADVRISADSETL